MILGLIMTFFRRAKSRIVGHGEGEIWSVMVRASYKALLKREPEGRIADSLESTQLSDTNFARIVSFMEDVVNSAEYRNSLPPRFVQPFSEDSWVTADIVDGLKLRVDLGDSGVSQPCIKGVYEPLETHFVKRVVKSGMTFLDVGANIGWFSIQAGALVGPKGKVISIEPRNTTFRELSRSVLENGFSSRFELHNIAVGRESGTMKIGWTENSGNPGGTWSLPDDGLIAMFDENNAVIQEIPMRRIDDVVAGRKIDFLKIDIEGAESIALAGAQKLLNEQRPIIMAEINPALLKMVSGITVDELLTQIFDHDYICRVLTETGLGAAYRGEALPEGHDMVNVSFIPSERTDID